MINKQRIVIPHHTNIQKEKIVTDITCNKITIKDNKRQKTIKSTLKLMIDANNDMISYK